MSIITFETLTFGPEDAAEADVAAAYNLGSVVIEHDAYGQIEVCHDDDWYTIYLGDEREEYFKGNDDDTVEALVELYR